MEAFRSLKAAMENNKPFLVMVLIQFIYTGQSLFSKAAVTEGMKPAVFVTYRQAIATIILAPFAFFFESNKTAHPLPFKVLFKMFLIALFGVTATLNLYLYAMYFISATFATAMANTIPVIVFILAVALRIETLNITQWDGIAKVFGTAISLSGAMVITFYKGPRLYADHGHEISKHPGRAYTAEEWIKGSILLLGSSFAWSIWLILQAPILKQYPAKLKFTTIQCCFSCVISAVYGAAVERNLSSWKLGWDVNLFSVTYCGVVVTGLSYWLQVWVVDKRGPVYTAIFSPLALILTGILSAVIFKETLHWGSILGALILVAGLYSYLWGKNAEHRVQSTDEEKSHQEIKKSPQAKEELQLEGITCTSSNPNDEGGREGK